MYYGHLFLLSVVPLILILFDDLSLFFPPLKNRFPLLTAAVDKFDKLGSILGLVIFSSSFLSFSSDFFSYVFASLTLPFKSVP